MERILSLRHAWLDAPDSGTSYRLNVIARLLVTTALVVAFVSASANAQTPERRAPNREGGLKAGARNAFVSIPAPFAAGKLGDLAAATILINFKGTWPAEARAAFQYAADIWETHIESRVTIRVDASWEALGENTLGSAGPYISIPPSGPGIISNTIYPVPLAEAILGRNLFGSTDPDIDAAFSSEFSNWYYGLDARPPANTYDFVTVVLHELGHGLGFTGSFVVEDADIEEDECARPATAGQGCWGYKLQSSSPTVYPLVFDRFTEDQNEVSLLNTSVYPNPSDTLGNVLESRAYYNSERSRRLNTDVPILLFSPATFEGGSSFSHLDETLFSGTLDALMTPSLDRAEAIHSPSGITCAIMGDLGWPLGPSCLQLLPTSTEDLPFTGLSVQPAHPNPFTSRTELLLTVDQPQRVRVEVYNVSGRRIATPPDRLLTPGAPERISLEGADWPAGLYLVRLTGETFTHTEKVIRLR